jgi:UTP--glucose-1-phosphate uridylyltransferase
MIRKVVIPAAGLGTRFLPATKAIPKEMLPIVDVPLIQVVVEEAVACGIDQIVIITGRGKDAIADHFDISFELEEVLARRGKVDLVRELRRIATLAEVVLVRQGEAKGLGHAVLCAHRVVGNEPFAVVLPDDIVDAETPCLKQLIAVHNERGGGVVALEKMARERLSHYGIADVASSPAARTHKLRGLVEKPAVDRAPSDLAVIGRYVLPPEVFGHLDRIAANNAKLGGEIQLTDALQSLAEEGKMWGLEFLGQRFDMGTPTGFLGANLTFAMKRPELRAALAPILRKVAP